MAWENILQQPSWIPQLIVSDPDAFVTAIQTTTSVNQYHNIFVTYFGSSYQGALIGDYVLNQKIAGNNNNFIKTESSSGSSVTLECYINGETASPRWRQYQSASGYKWAFYALVNHQTNQGFFGTVVQRVSDGYLTYAAGNLNKISDSSILSYMYTILTANPYRSSYGAAGGGSGHIADGEVPTFNKYMVGYNVPTSNDVETKTRTTTKHSPTPISGYAKEGNGYCRITYLGPTPAPSIKNITEDGVFTYVEMDMPPSYYEVTLFISEEILSDPWYDDNALRYTMKCSNVKRDTNIAKLALKANTLYYLTVCYLKDSSAHRQYVDPVPYTTGTSSVSGIEVVDLNGIISTKLSQSVLNTILNNYYNNIDGAALVAGATIGTNFVPPTYPTTDEYDHFEQMFDDTFDGSEVKFFYQSYAYNNSYAYCNLGWELYLDYHNTSNNKWSYKPHNGTDVEEASALESNYINSFVFVLDHDNKRGLPLLLSGKTTSGEYIYIQNYLKESYLYQNYRTGFMLWYRYLYENRKVQIREQLIYMNEAQITEALKKSGAQKEFYYIYGDDANAFPNGYNRFTTADSNDYTDSELVTTMKVANCSKIEKIRPYFYSYIDGYTFGQFQPFTSSQRIRNKSSAIYGNTSWHLIETSYNVLDDINDDNEHTIVIKYKSKQHSQDEYSLDSIECYLDGILKHTQQIYVSGSQYAPNNGPLGNGKVNNVSYSFPFNVYSASYNHNLNVELNDSIRVNQVQSYKIGGMNSMIFTAPYQGGDTPEVSTTWGGLVEKGDYVQDYGIDLISYYQRMCNDPSYTGELIYREDEFWLSCGRDTTNNTFYFYLYRNYYDPYRGAVATGYGHVGISLNSAYQNLYSHLYICFSFNNYVNNSQTLGSSVYILGEQNANPSYLDVVGMFTDNPNSLYYHIYYKQLVKTCLKEFSLELVK